MVVLSQDAIKAIKDSRDLKNRLMVMFGCSERTLYTYLNNNDPKLTMHSVLELITDYTGLDIQTALNHN